MDVLREAREQLDGCFFTFKNSRPEFCNLNKRGYYPFTPKPKDMEPTEGEDDLVKTHQFMKQKLDEMKMDNFSTKLPALFEFLCKRQAGYSKKYYFVPEFCRIVNEKKHENSFNEHDEYYGLAHCACLYVEELAIELCKPMPVLCYVSPWLLS